MRPVSSSERSTGRSRGRTNLADGTVDGRIRRHRRRERRHPAASGWDRGPAGHRRVAAGRARLMPLRCRMRNAAIVALTTAALDLAVTDPLLDPALAASAARHARSPRSVASSAAATALLDRAQAAAARAGAPPASCSSIELIHAVIADVAGPPRGAPQARPPHRRSGADEGGQYFVWQSARSDRRDRRARPATSIEPRGTPLHVARMDASPGAAAPRTATWRPAIVRGGWRAVRANPPLTQMFALHGFSQIAQAGSSSCSWRSWSTLDDDGSGLGLIRGTMAIGALLGRRSSTASPTDSGRPCSTAPAARCTATGGAGSRAAFCERAAPAVTTGSGVYVVLLWSGDIRGHDRRCPCGTSRRSHRSARGRHGTDGQTPASAHHEALGRVARADAAPLGAAATRLRARSRPAGL